MINNETMVGKLGFAILLIAMSAAVIAGVFTPAALAAGDNLTITADTQSVYVGEPKDVKFTVTEITCTPQNDTVCTLEVTYVQGATVTLTGRATGSGTTGTNGTTVIRVLAAIQGDITATASYNGSSASTVIKVYARKGLNIVADTDFVIVGIPKNVKFTVTEDCPPGAVACTQGSIVPGASVQLTGAASGSGTTGTDGTVPININAGSQGTITATASKDGYTSGTAAIKAELPPNLNITANPDSVFIGISGNVKFTVTESCLEGTDACTQGSVVPGASVQLTGAFSAGATTGTDGTVTIPINASSPGTITATASKSGFTDGSTTITVDYFPHAKITVEKNRYFRGEPVNFTFTNTGTTTIGTGLWLIYNVSKPIAPVNATPIAGDFLAPGESAYIPWNQKDTKGQQVSPGMYKGSATYNNSFETYTDPFEITSCSLPVNYPPITANSTVGQDMPFKSGNLTKTEKTWNVTWYINGTQVDRETGVTQVSAYTNRSAAPGVWNVTAVADSGCDTITWTIIWTVKSGLCTNTVFEPITANSTVGQDMPFKSGNLSKTEKTWNVTWYINGTQVDRETGVTQVSAYTNRSAAPGVWNVTAVADSGCDTITWTIIWTVKPAPPGCLNIVNNQKTYSSYAGDEIIFLSGNLSNVNKTWDGKWNFTWYVNGNAVYNETNVSQSSMKRTGAVGVWNITAIANHDCNKVNWTWVWTVTPKPSNPGGGGSSGGSGGGGGGGITTAEPFANILKFERQDADLKRGSAVPYTFTSHVFSIYQVLVTGKENEGQVGIRIEHLKDTSALVSRMPAGIIYANENIWVGSKRIDYVVLRFRVNNSWITENKLDKTDIKLLRFDNGWKKLNTTEINSDSTYTYFESGSPGLSSFAISGLKEGTQDARGIQALAEDTNPDAETDMNNSNPTETSPGIGIIAGIGIISVAYLFWIRRRK